jgi:hypothetical protein
MSNEFTDATEQSIRLELATIWKAHHAVGLRGKMAIYSENSQETWRSKSPGLITWFGPEDTDDVLELVRLHYNNGQLSNTTYLLNPVVHSEDDERLPLGSGIYWANGMALGINSMEPTQRERMSHLGAYTAPFDRGDIRNVGFKMLAFSDKPLKVLPDGAVEGCAELYAISNFKSDDYYRYYMFSGLSYLARHGLFRQENFADMRLDNTPLPESHPKTIDLQYLKDAAFCWESYERHHSLYKKFGVQPGNVENNLRFYRLCNNDIELFDATGAKHADADTAVSFKFIVDGWLPMGAVTVIGASGGTGKSSLAHNLAVKAAIDYRPDEPNPTWLGSKMNLEYCKGLCVYFSGEDGPAIVHTRAKVYDPEGRAHRLMFQRTDFGEGGDLSSFMRRLMKLPDVSLIVIDPARKYLTGDEDDAGVVSQFFEAIEEFAIQRNTAVIVVHHLLKGARPGNISEIYDLLRGSQVFIDRPRVVIGMYREKDYVVAGLAKNNIPPQMGMVQGEHLFHRDAERLELVPVEGPKGIRMERWATDDE